MSAIGGPEGEAQPAPNAGPAAAPGARTWLSHGAEVLAGILARNQASPIPPTFDCDVLIVGSGYGGAVAAARLAGRTVADAAVEGGRRLIKVWVLERGLEHLPGRFPSRFGELPGAVRFSSQNGKGPRGNAEGLFDVRMGKDVNVLLGNGLGGGSLINAGVMERPRDEVLEQGWPNGLNAASLKSGYDQVIAMFDPEKLPDDIILPKLTALERTAAGGGASAGRCYAAVSYSARPTLSGVSMNACTLCGDCITGCNQGAKKTLDTNYLAWAKRAGAELFCGGWVESIRLDGASGSWLVDWHFTLQGKRPPHEKPFTILARNVVLAAGSLGSTEILLRSRRRGLALSEMLGQKFSTNGDMIAAGYRQNHEVHACADEDTDPSKPTTRMVGPAITGLIRTKAKGTPIAVEEFGIPAPLRRVMGEVTTTFGLLQRLFKMAAIKPHPVDRLWGEDDLAVTTSSLEYTSIYGMMGDDGASGRIEFEEPVEAPAARGDREKSAHGDGRVSIKWGDRKQLNKLFDRQLAWLERACRDKISPAGPGGTVIPNPSWEPLPKLFGRKGRIFSGSATTVHPLGGCAMGNSVADGVVDHIGRVFDPNSLAADERVHRGLAVLDGSIVPKALAINPALTIAALAERAVPILAAKWGVEWPASEPTGPCLERPGPIARREVAAARTGVKIREQLRGEIDLGHGMLEAEIEIKFNEIPDLADMVRRQQRVVDFESATLRLAGSEVPLIGRMTLLADEPVSRRDAWRMREGCLQILRDRLSLGKAGGIAALLAPRYLRHVALSRILRYEFQVDGATAVEGLSPGARFVGIKTIAFKANANPWLQFSKITLSWQAGMKELGKLEADLDYFADRREALVNITVQRDSSTALADIAALGLLVLRLLIRTHAVHFVPSKDITYDHRRERRCPDRIGDIERRQFPPGNGSDAFPQLSRYKPENVTSARPLLMIHGLGASGSTFTSEAIRFCSLAKFMLGQGRDVWVLDLRTSIANPNHDDGLHSFEHIARTDIPWAMNTICEQIVRETSIQTKVDVVAHCIGSAMFCVAVLQHQTLYQNVGCAVLSQVGPLVKMSPMNRLRGYLASYLEQFLSVEEFDTRPGEPTTETPVSPPAPPPERPIKPLDLLLATFPYLSDDKEWTRAAQVRKAGFGDFRTVRHRADAIFGQTMHLDNMAPETLGALDAIYGWVKVGTLAQTIHFARHGLITDADGDNEAVGYEALSKRFGFPVLLVHGKLNRVFDWKGGERSYRMLARLFGDAGAVETDRQGNQRYGGTERRQLLVLKDYGHQDTLIGKDAGSAVFPAMREFLLQWANPPDRPYPALPPPNVFEAPWMGPMLGWARGTMEDTRLIVLLLVHPMPRQAQTQWVVVVPLQKAGGVWVADSDQARGFRVRNSGKQKLPLRANALKVAFHRERAAAYAAFAAVTLHLEFPPRAGSDDSPDDVLIGMAFGGEISKEISAFVDLGGNALERSIFRIDRAIAAREGQPAAINAPPITFVLASCQYPPGLMDEACADASLRRLLKDLGDPGKTQPRFWLLCGDQVYLDATAGVFDPAGDADDIARHAYELNWRMPSFRAVAARLPTFTMLDDHEVEDNWQPSAERSRYEDEALKAFKSHQAKLNPPRISGVSSSYKFAPAGLPMFVLDTRTQRQRRSVDGATGTSALASAEIVSTDDMRRVKQWLRQQRDSPVKFIVSPSVVLPEVRVKHFEERLGLDSWSGYPRSLADLLGFIDDNEIDGVVFLSGDFHLSIACAFTFESGRTVHSVVSSGLYTPWPFANGRPEDCVLDGLLELVRPPLVLPAFGPPAPPIRGTMTKGCVSTKAGYAALTVSPGAPGTLHLNVEFKANDGQAVGCSYVLVY